MRQMVSNVALYARKKSNKCTLFCTVLHIFVKHTTVKGKVHLNPFRLLRITIDTSSETRLIPLHGTRTGRPAQRRWAVVPDTKSTP